MKNTFRTLIGLQMLLLIASIAAATTTFRQMQMEYHIPMSLFAVTAEFGWIGNILLAGLLIASIGLLVFWNATRHIYASIVIGDLLLTISRKAVFRSGATDMLHVAFAVVTGVILAMIYFTPLRDLFTNPQAATPLATAPKPPFPPPVVPPQWPPQPPIMPPEPPAPVASVRVCAVCGAGDQDGKFCTQCGQPVAAKPRWS